MPWTETSVVDQRMRFCLRAIQDLEPFADLCREFGISRRTGYKWKERFLERGMQGLSDELRRPDRSPNQIPEAMVCQIVKLRNAHPTWGAPKLRALLARTVSAEELPSESSIKRILERAGLVERRRKRTSESAGRLQTPTRSERPNHVWTIDFKGWWYTRDRSRFEPLTIRDDFSRYVLCAQSLEDARSDTVRQQMVRTFARYGLPEVIRSDNGAPFAASHSPLGLSRLSAWWLMLGIDLDRIPPARPDQNGGHERMHRDMAWEVEDKAELDVATQQASLDVWRRTFNEERPHQALGMRVPHEVYQPSPRKFHPAPVELEYPGRYLVRKVNATGKVSIHSSSIRITEALRGLEVGLEPLSADRLAVWFCRLCLGQIDLSTQKFTAAATAEPSPTTAAEPSDSQENMATKVEIFRPLGPGGEEAEATRDAHPQSFPSVTF